MKSFSVNNLTIELFNKFYFYFNKVFKNKKNNLVDIENFFIRLTKLTNGTGCMERKVFSNTNLSYHLKIGRKLIMR